MIDNETTVHQRSNEMNISYLIQNNGKKYVNIKIQPATMRKSHTIWSGIYIYIYIKAPK